MLRLDQSRRVQVRQAGGWVESELGRLEPGDVFCLIEPDGQLVEDPAGHALFRATTWPAVQCEPADV